MLIKASAGGGGKGMRRVDQAADFAAALASCQREAQASFGDDHVLVERYVTRPRHIEIQVFADSLGQCIHLFERDCSVQRRHQKVLEEAPAPGMSDARRAEMGAAAVAAAQAVGYVGAGTVEFIAEEIGDGDLRFYFMEMNTRLQVEHPVTEAITGLDLVEWQLRVAAGEPLPMAQDELKIHGHAIEARICAENPDANFLPATGTLLAARWPAHVAFRRNADAERHHEPAPVRIDRGFDEGDAITPYYDSMIAKLIVWGADRAQALARLDAALRDTHLVGLHSNVALLRRVVEQPGLRDRRPGHVADRARAAGALRRRAAGAGGRGRGRRGAGAGSRVGARRRRPLEPARRLAPARRRTASLRPRGRRRPAGLDADAPARRHHGVRDRRPALCVRGPVARRRAVRRHAGLIVGCACRPTVTASGWRSSRPKAAPS